MTKTTTTSPAQEEFAISGKDVLNKIKALIKEGNVRRLTIKDKNGKVIIVVPLTLGILGAVIVPPLALIGGIVALMTECVICVERQ